MTDLKEVTETDRLVNQRVKMTAIMANGRDRREGRDASLVP